MIKIRFIRNAVWNRVCLISEYNSRLIKHWYIVTLTWNHWCLMCVATEGGEWGIRLPYWTFQDRNILWWNTSINELSKIYIWPVLFASHSINMEQVYTTKTVCILNVMKTKCKKIDESQWLASLPLKPKLRTYILYKNHS